MTIREYRTAYPNATAAEIVAMRAAEPPVAKASSIGSTYLTYLAIGQLLGNNVAGTMSDTLLEWCSLSDLSELNPLLPNPAALRRLHSRLDGYPGVDMSAPEAPALMALFSGTPNLGRPLIVTPERSLVLLAVGYAFPEPITVNDVAADIAAEETEILVAAKKVLREQISADWNKRSDFLDNAATLPTLDELRSITADLT